MAWLFWVRLFCSFFKFFQSQSFEFTISALTAVPSTLALSTPMFCNFCTEELCSEDLTHLKNENGTLLASKTANYNDPNYNGFWLPQACTFNNRYMRKTLLFFPLLILIAPAVIYIIEQGFKFISKSSAKMDALHQLIIQSKDDKILEKDNSKLALEVIQAFHNSSSFSKTYLLR